MSKSNKYGYSGVDIPTQAFQANVGKFDPAEINELVAEDKWTQYGQLELINTYTADGSSSALYLTNIQEDVYSVHLLVAYDFYNASNFVSAIENRQGLKIACLEEIALQQKWIGKKEIKKSILFYGNCEYSKYLKSLIN